MSVRRGLTTETQRAQRRQKAEKKEEERNALREEARAGFPFSLSVFSSCLLCVLRVSVVNPLLPYSPFILHAASSAVQASRPGLGVRIMKNG
jgi:hypothetical protein